MIPGRVTFVINKEGKIILKYVTPEDLGGSKNSNMNFQGKGNLSGSNLNQGQVIYLFITVSIWAPSNYPTESSK